MAIFQPSNVIPSTFAGVGLGTIDVNSRTEISWQVNGNSPMTAFRIRIYNNAQPENLTSIKDTGIITDGIPSGGFYGVDNKGNPKQFIYNPELNWNEWCTDLENGNEYKMVITQYWGSDPEETSSSQITQWSASVFFTRNKPVIRFNIGSSDEGTVYAYTVTSRISSYTDYYYKRTDYSTQYYFKLSESVAVDTVIMFNPTDEIGFYYSTSSQTYKSFTLSTSHTGSPINIFTCINANEDGYAYSDNPIVEISARLETSDGEPISNETIEWVQWDVYTFDAVNKTKKTLIFDTGKINTQELFFKTDFIQENSFYNIRCTIQNEYGVTSGNGFVLFYHSTNTSFVGTTTICKTLNDGSISLSVSTGSSNVDSFVFYLEREDYNIYLYELKNIVSNKQEIKIYSIPNNISPKFNIYNKNNEGKYSSPKKVVCTNFFNNSYYLYETAQDENNPNVYHLLNFWRFGNNISFGSISNNNTPNWLTNYTPYRLKQPTSRMGKSGTLQALLSNYDTSQNKYIDTALMMENLYQASKRNNTFFLKDVKGNLYMVDISSPITQTINTKSKIQEVKVTIPWEEVGDASNVSIIKTTTPQEIIKNEVADVRFVVNVENGNLYVDYPIDYNGTEFSIRGNELYGDTPSNMEEAEFEIRDGILYATVDTEN